MLRPLAEPKRERRIRYSTYDGEWNKEGSPKKLRIMGAFDGERYRVYRTMAEFLDNELIPANHGKRFYAHNSGASDIEFVLEEILTCPGRAGFHVSGVFSGASAIIVEISRGRYSWVFVDSLWTIRDSLRNIGRWLKMYKGEVNFDTANIHELTDYNELDCRILYEAIRQFEDAIIDLGSELGMTAASTALRLFQRAYLGRDEPQGPIVRPEGIETSHVMNERLRAAYCGGRTEPWDQRRGLAGYVYDVRSAYPAAMQFPVPGELCGHLEGRRPSSKHKDLLYLMDATINVPEDIKVPPLPRVAEGSLFFDVGPRRGWFCQPEIELAEEWGCEVLQVHECMLFEPMHDLAAFSQDLFDKREACKKSNSSKFLNQTYKILNNGCYGKFAERAEKATLHINPPPEVIRQARSWAAYSKGEFSAICPGVWLVQHEAKIRHAHVPIAAFITSRARANLARHLAKTEPWYCDTDSIACGDPNIDVGEKLGDLQLEKSFTHGYFRGAKFYIMQMSQKDEQKLRRDEEQLTGQAYRMTQTDEDGETYTIPGQLCWDFERTAIRAKGFSRLMAGGFNELDRGGQVPIDAMLMKLREMYGAGHVTPRETTRIKQVRDRVRPKRRPLADGRTVAWHVRDFDRPYAVVKTIDEVLREMMNEREERKASLEAV